MRKYLVRLERCNYLVNGSTASHGFTGYIDTSQSDYSWALNESDVSTLALHASTALGFPPGINFTELAGLLGRDINSDDAERDNLLGVFTPHTHSRNGVRSSPSNYIRATVGDERKFPLTLQLNTLATKIIFDQPADGNTAPRAVGVEYLQGQSLYSRDPRHDPSQVGVPGKAFASKEVIISGGVFNTPQLLKLSGVGPADELEKFDIPLIEDLPGVGINMHDNLEGVIYGTFEKPVVGFWDMFMRTSVAERTRDIHFYCGSFNFMGFFPGMPGWAENEFECGFMQLHPRNINGTVKLRSTDPREAPNIHLGFFSQGDDADLDSMVEAINLARSVLTNLTDTHSLSTDLVVKVLRAARTRSKRLFFESRHTPIMLLDPVQSGRMMIRWLCWTPSSEFVGYKGFESLMGPSFRSSRERCRPWLLSWSARKHWVIFLRMLRGLS
ncbi:hypothetical protein KNSL1_007377 [Colletotrichum chrysophilum]|nr:hypothetical protein KNSL1_007377 [Colletotrichum chrysophilum]